MADDTLTPTPESAGTVAKCTAAELSAVAMTIEILSATAPTRPELLDICIANTGIIILISHIANSNTQSLRRRSCQRRGEMDHERAFKEAQGMAIDYARKATATAGLGLTNTPSPWALVNATQALAWAQIAANELAAHSNE